MEKNPKHEAKRNMLQELKKMASGMMGDELKGKMDGMKKVTVAAKDDDSLKAGLDMAKDIMGKTDEDADKTDTKAKSEVMDAGSNTDDIEEELGLESAEDAEESEEMSPEEIQAKIKELQAKLKK
jgi:hypothetical protein